MLMKEQTEGAIKTYIQLLDKTPDNFNSLSQLIELLRRAGRVQDIKQHITNAETACQRSNAAGLAFCKGLLSRFSGDPMQALKDLNVARFDNFYGQSACIYMVEIYLNPANEMIFSSIGSDSEYNTTPENVVVAKELIGELQTQGVDTSILECMALISTKEKTQLEQASRNL